MHLYKTIEEFNSSFNCLFGQKIIKIEYIGLNYEEYENKYFTKYENIHTMDFSIILYTDKNNKYEITWDNSFYSYGLGILINDFKNENKSSIKWDMTNDIFWEKYLNKNILGIYFLWETVTEWNNDKKIIKNTYTYPQTCRLGFDGINGKDDIFISVAEFLDENDNTVMGMMDNIIVTNDINKAIKINIY